MTFARFPALSRRRLLIGLGSVAFSDCGPLGLLRAFGSTVTRPTGTVTAVAFDQNTLVLAAAGIWTSADGGVSFLAKSDRPRATVAALATHPDLAGIIYAATNGGLFQSVDAGLSWQDVGHGLPVAPLDAVAIAAHDPQIVYVAVRAMGFGKARTGRKAGSLQWIARWWTRSRWMCRR